jgi:hypothetical protein
MYVLKEPRPTPHFNMRYLCTISSAKTYSSIFIVLQVLQLDIFTIGGTSEHKTPRPGTVEQLWPPTQGSDVIVDRKGVEDGPVAVASGAAVIGWS